MTTALDTDDWFAPVLASGACHRLDGDGHHAVLPVARWHGSPAPAELPLLDRCQGSTVDVGCGPGRLTAALATRGRVALGVDTSRYAVRLTRARGAAALCRSVFDRLPGEGGWDHVLLVDGNVGIGGDPITLLRRCAALLRRNGTLLVEVGPPGAPAWRGHSRVVHSAGRTRPFPWARVGLDAVPGLADDADLTLDTVLDDRDGRWFVELRLR